MPENITIRVAAPAEVPAITSLIRSVLPFLTKADDGVSFASTVTEENVLGFVTENDGRYQVAFVDGELAGVVSVRDNSHLFHLYVAERFHRRGIARALWQAARDDAQARGNPGRFTVKSSPYAVGVYERFGFKATGPRAEQGGLAYVPMLLEPSP